MTDRSTTRARRTLAAATAVLVTALVTACGADTERSASTSPSTDSPTSAAAARAVIERFAAASRARDYQVICDQLLSQSLVRAVESVGLPCESALQRGLAGVRDPQITVRQVSIQGDRALASVHSTATGQPPSDDAMQLAVEGGTWRIASLADAMPSSTAPPASTATPRSSATPATSRARTRTGSP